MRALKLLKPSDFVPTLHVVTSQTRNGLMKVRSACLMGDRLRRKIVYRGSGARLRRSRFVRGKYNYAACGVSSSSGFGSKEVKNT